MPSGPRLTTSNAAVKNGPPASAKTADMLSDRVYMRIRDDIIDCELVPGMRITETQLTQRYGVGKAPIRTSLARLRQDGLVAPMAKRGYLVAPISMQDVYDVYQARLVIEPECARLAASRIDVDELNAIEEVLEAGYQPGDRTSERSWIEANRSFHLAIAQASGSQHLFAIARDLLMECDRIIHLAMRVDQTLERRYSHGHNPITDALRVGDGDHARDELFKAIRESRDVALEILLRTPSLLGAELTVPIDA